MIDANPRHHLSLKNMRYFAQKRKMASKLFLYLIIACAVVLTSAPRVQADTFDEQIKALQHEIEGFQEEAGRLRSQADTLQNQIRALQAERSTIQKQIELNEAELVRLNEEIVRTEQRLQNQMTLLAGNLRAMYLESKVTPLEMVASSSSISDFIDKQEYRNKIRDQVQKNIATVRDLKVQLAEQKKAVEKNLADQKIQKETLIAKETEQANLLAQTQGQEVAYQQLTKEKNSQIAELRAQQIAANQRNMRGNVVPGDPGRGGYPSVWHNAPRDSLVDNWGMYNRECVSYTAWKVYQSGRHMPYWGGRGNANQWPNSAAQDGIPTGSEPRVGAVAISMGGPWGHAMYVEAVLNGGSQVYVSQYNYGVNGEYSEMTLSSSGLIYIYF
ncbi:MAG TPA: CHAP domain-containing protein [Candidatus Saccharimonadales bacterium]|nr:CHAP domain-containing protein [Candidatus Saccharimonadales bacterium]